MLHNREMCLLVIRNVIRLGRLASFHSFRLHPPFLRVFWCIYFAARSMCRLVNTRLAGCSWQSADCLLLWDLNYGGKNPAVRARRQLVLGWHASWDLIGSLLLCSWPFIIASNGGLQKNSPLCPLLCSSTASRRHSLSILLPFILVILNAIFCRCVDSICVIIFCGNAPEDALVWSEMMHLIWVKANPLVVFVGSIFASTVRSLPPTAVICMLTVLDPASFSF